MPTIPCDNKINCPPCDDSPFGNLTAEGADVDRFLSVNFFVGDPPLNTSFGQLGCKEWCWSDTSQDDADDCASLQATECVITTFRNPTTQPQLYRNTPQSCSATCANGGNYSYTVSAGEIVGLSQQEADAIALSIACSRAERDAASADCRFYNVEYTAECPLGYIGDPVTIPAGTYSSVSSQGAADALAVAAANAYLEEFCVTGCSDAGTPTPCTLKVADNTILGVQSIADVTVPGGTASYGSFGPGQYRLEYVSGCWFFTTTDFINPPARPIYESSGHAISYGASGLGTSQQTDPLPDTGQVDDPDGCAIINAQMAGQTYTFEQLRLVLNPITLKFTLDDTGGFEYSNGSPNNPQWQLRRLSIYPTLPSRVRIKDFDPVAFHVCEDNDSSANPAWDGTLPDATIQHISETYYWEPVNNITLNGQDVNATLAYYSDASLPTPTGCGWEMYIFLSSDDLWIGYKPVGTDPTGCYTRANGCSLFPEVLVIESY